MSNAVAEGLFLLAFWMPPLIIALGGLALLVPVRSPRRVTAASQTPRLAH